MSDLLLENERLSLLISKRDDENRNLKEVINELMTESNSKDQAIAKASKVIDMLREDLEKSWNSLKSSENTKSKLIRENHDLEKELIEVKKSSHQMAVMKNAEKRAKNEKMKLKEELNQTTKDFGNKETEFFKKHNDLIEENKRISSKLESYQGKIKDLQEKSENLEKELSISEELVKSLEFRIEESGITIEKLENEKSACLQNSQNEIALIKREAENKIRTLQNIRETGKNQAKSIRTRENNEISNENYEKTLKKKRGFSNNNRKVYNEAEENLNDGQTFENEKIENNENKPILAEFLKETINESVEKEKKLLEKLDKLMNRESRTLNEKIEGLFSQEIALRPEIERWMMKTEELSMKLEDCYRKMANMTIIIRDFEKLVNLNKKLSFEDKKNSDNLARELETNVNFFQIEVQEKNKLFQENFMQNYETFQHLLETSQGKIQDLMQNLAFLQQNNNLLKQDRDFLFSSFNDYKRDMQNLISQILLIQKKLDIFNEKNEFSSEKSENFESLMKFEEIFRKIDDFNEKTASLDHENYALKTEKNNDKYVFDSERLQINEQLNYLQENLTKMNKRLEECNEIIENLEKQNSELRNKQNNEKNELLLSKLQKKRLKIANLKKKLLENEKPQQEKPQIRENLSIIKNQEKIRKSLGNSMSFEENPFKTILNTGDNSEISLEFNSVKDPEIFKAKFIENKAKYQRKLREFELLLRYFEKSLDFLIDNNNLYEEKDQQFLELLDRNENIRNWVFKLKSAFQILVNKSQRVFSIEKEFLMKIATFLLENLDIRNGELENSLENLKISGLGIEKMNGVHNIRMRILENIENFNKKSFKTPKKDRNSTESLMFLKEIYSDLKETLTKCSVFSSKLDEKAKKLPNFQQIIADDSTNILKVLDENLRESEEKYRNNLGFLWENFLISLKEARSFGNNEDFIENQFKHLFFSGLDSLNMKKMQNEVQNLKSAMNLLEISHFQQFLKPEEKTAEILRMKTLQNNEILGILIEKSEILLDIMEIPYNGLDWNVYLEQNPLDYEKRIKTFLEKRGDGLLKNSISKLFFELIRENAGFKIAMNTLSNIMQKYKGIIEELMRVRTVY